ncbi:MAG: hypothetical protein IJX30_04395 [Clostridia bacterium]|nr:hypothetical protein [Clostridia bacterium]
MDKIKKYLPLGAAAFGVIALIMVFLPSVKLEFWGVEETWNGFQTAFGHKEDGQTVFKFSFMNCVTWALLIGGIACAVLSYMNANNKLFGYIAIVALFVAGIFFFCTVGFLNVEQEAKDMLDLGAGAIIAGICSILAAICAAAPTAMDMLGIK